MSDKIYRELRAGDLESTAIVDLQGYVVYRGDPSFTEEDARLFAAASKLLMACEGALFVLKDKYEDQATLQAYRAGLGASEWEAFMPPAYVVLVRAINAAKGTCDA